jgi:hypothetical protein
MQRRQAAGGVKRRTLINAEKRNPVIAVQESPPEQEKTNFFRSGDISWPPCI